MNNQMDTEQMKKQTLKWLESVPNNKKNPKKMQMVIMNGKPVFIPVI